LNFFSLKNHKKSTVEVILDPQTDLSLKIMIFCRKNSVPKNKTKMAAKIQDGGRILFFQYKTNKKFIFEGFKRMHY
jgi:hypothetical protein